jgi:hypothetical protein
MSTSTNHVRALSADAVSLIVSLFPTAIPGGPAFGDPEAITWAAFTDVLCGRREGPKDGPLFCPARFQLEDDGRHVRRLARNVVARTLVALDVETNKKTGEIPPPPEEVAQRLRDKGWAAVTYTSHSHVRDTDIRFRVVLPIGEEIAPELPAPEIVAATLKLAGVLDHSKLNAASIFYLPSCADIEQEDQHQTIVCPGASLDAAWLREAAGALLATRQAEQATVAAEAHAAAQRRLEARIAAGFNSDDSLIEKLRSRLDLAAVLAAHSYDRQGTKFRHPNSSSGSYGADIKTYGGIERVYSHNGTDPLHRDNLPAWCDVTALDVVDVVTILDFSGDRTRALRELAERFSLSKTEERRTVARLIFRLIRQQASQEAIEADAVVEGLRLGLSRSEVIEVATWCVQKLREAA